MKTPVLLIIFNRLETTQKVFSRIRDIKPKQLFIAADGPRPDKEEDVKLCTSVRKWVLENVDWECEVKTHFRNSNMGCGKGPADAISWFFGQVEEGIILEDDCVPSLTFFSYCSELLKKYKYEEKVMLITGLSFLPKSRKYPADYFFSEIGHIWGWATWKRAWQKFRFELQDNEIRLFSTVSNTVVRNSLETTFRAQIMGNVDAWDVQWTISILRNNGLAVVPVLNLINNIGLHGTHFNGDTPFHNLKSYEFHNELRHPLVIDFKSKLKEMNERIYELHILANNCRGRRYLLKKMLIKIKLQLLKIYIRSKKLDASVV